jgi:hypothetical protein
MIQGKIRQFHQIINIDWRGNRDEAIRRERKVMKGCPVVIPTVKQKQI